MTLGRSRISRLRRNMGSVSTGTMRERDLIPAFMYELEAQRPLQRAHAKLLREIRARMDVKSVGGYYATDEASYDLDALFDALNEYCLPYFSFGAHPGDGADYGYWLSEEFREEFDGLEVADTSEVPKSYNGEVLHVNDHGNMTLYVASRGKLREVWGLV